jgi:chemotaxis response regulator CheB
LVRIFVVDDSATARAALKSALEGRADWVVVAEAVEEARGVGIKGLCPKNDMRCLLNAIEAVLGGGILNSCCAFC